MKRRFSKAKSLQSAVTRNQKEIPDVTKLDELERRAKSEPELQSLNLQAVGVLGQSLGGYTVLAAAGAQLSREKL
ncbi:MAG: hypothetical protein AAF915_28945, partial [Cyanobacteria bacterium P01_D01_bin.50]